MKRWGVFGVALMGLHILFHVVECLVLPAILVALGGHAVEERAVAKDGESGVERSIVEISTANDLVPRTQLLDFQQSLESLALEF